VVLATDNMIDPETARSLRENWERVHRGPDRSNRTAVLTNGLKPVEFGGTNQESQFLETRRFSVEEICRIYGCPPHLVGDLTRSSFSNIEQQSLDYLQNTLLGWLRRFESAFARDLITDDSLFAEFDVRGLLRGDATARASYYQTLWNLGVASINEIRSWENLDPVEAGDTRFVQLNMTTLDRAASLPEPTATLETPATEPTAAAVPTDAAPGEPQAADVSLNGSQITGLLAILQAVSTGVFTKSGAAAAVAAAFPFIPRPQVDAILAGVPEPASPVPVPPPPARSQPESRAMTISIDFDRTFAADPALWGEFARKAVSDGNTVVMVSRRPDTADDRQTVADTLGEYADAFSRVLLVGDTLKDDAAKAAGVTVDVWVDDSPQFVRKYAKPRRKRKGSDGGTV
jgi:hypothetical protein